MGWEGGGREENAQITYTIPFLYHAVSGVSALQVDWSTTHSLHPSPPPSVPPSLLSLPPSFCPLHPSFLSLPPSLPLSLPLPLTLSWFLLKKQLLMLWSSILSTYHQSCGTCIPVMRPFTFLPSSTTTTFHPHPAHSLPTLKVLLLHSHTNRLMLHHTVSIDSILVDI